jgi:hypothetical protein
MMEIGSLGLFPCGCDQDGWAMLRGLSPQGAYELAEGDARVEQFEMLRDFILEEYYRLEQVEGWKLSEMKRPDRKTVLRLIRFFLNEI